MRQKIQANQPESLSGFTHPLLYLAGLLLLVWLVIEALLLITRLLPRELLVLWQQSNVPLYARASWLDISALLHGLVLIIPLCLLSAHNAVLQITARPLKQIYARLTTAFVALILLFALYQPAISALKQRAGAFDPLGWPYAFVLHALPLVLGGGLLLAALLMHRSTNNTPEGDQGASL